MIVTRTLMHDFKTKQRTLLTSSDQPLRFFFYDRPATFFILCATFLCLKPARLMLSVHTVGKISCVYILYYLQLTVHYISILLTLLYIWACAKRCSVWTIHFLVVNASSGLSFPWTNLTLSERVCIKEIIKINLTPKVSFELVKYENLHQVRAKKSAKEGWTFRVHRFSCRFVCIFLL